MPVVRIGEAARLLGASDDALRRWANAGRFTSTTSESGRWARWPPRSGLARASLAKPEAKS